MELPIGQRFRNTPKYLRAVFFLAAIAGLALFLLYLSLYLYAKILGPPPIAVPQSTLYYSDTGSLIGETDNGQKRYWTSIHSISPALIDATVAVEDRKFYSHHGFDLKRIAGAVLADIKAMGKVQGASTITQQYARNLYLGHAKTWTRKFHEALYTFRLEMNYSKAEILEGYLNTIYYGHGVYGAKAASLFYFGKEPADLTEAEAAMLAGIPKGPSRYSPLLHIDYAQQRQQVVLDAMVKENILSRKAAKAAAEAPVKIIGEYEMKKTKTAPYFQDAVKAALKNELHLDDRTIELGGLKVYTTLNEHSQQAAEKAFESVIDSSSAIQGALVAMNPSNGEVKALVGGRDYQHSPFNRATQALRQPGSTMKPVLYYSALEHGFTPSTLLLSEPTVFDYDNGTSSYTPHNYNNQYAGKEITMAQAIALSDNIYAVKTHLFLGMDRLVKTARTFGITSPLNEVPSLALGTSVVHPIEMVNAYSMLANGGKEVSPVFITKVINADGDVIFETENQHNQVLDPDQTAVLTDMLTGVFDEKLNGYTKVTGSTIAAGLSRTYAGKSGSTAADSWMIGYTPRLAAGVWTGYDQDRRIEKPAEKVYAKKIWASFMEQSLKNESEKKFRPTRNVIYAAVDPESGQLAGPGCPVSRMTAFVKGTEPKRYCPDHIRQQNKTPADETQEEDRPWFKKLFRFRH